VHNRKASNALCMLVKREKFSGPSENCQRNVTDLAGSLVTSSRPPGRLQKMPDDRTLNAGVAVRTADGSRWTADASAACRAFPIIGNIAACLLHCSSLPAASCTCWCPCCRIMLVAYSLKWCQDQTRQILAVKFCTAIRQQCIAVSTPSNPD